MGDRVPAPDAMEHVPVGTNQDMASKKGGVVACAKVPRSFLALGFLADFLLPGVREFLLVVFQCCKVSVFRLA